MEIPDIPDNRPNKTPSVLSYSPTIVLDGATEYDFEQPHQKDSYQDMRYQDMRKAPPQGGRQEQEQGLNQDLSTPEPQEKPEEKLEELRIDEMPNDGQR